MRIYMVQRARLGIPDAGDRGGGAAARDGGHPTGGTTPLAQDKSPQRPPLHRPAGVCRYAAPTAGAAALDVLPVVGPSLRTPPPRLVAAATDASPPLPMLAV